MSLTPSNDFWEGAVSASVLQPDGRGTTFELCPHDDYVDTLPTMNIRRCRHCPAFTFCLPGSTPLPLGPWLRVWLPDVDPAAIEDAVADQAAIERLLGP